MGEWARENLDFAQEAEVVGKKIQDARLVIFDLDDTLFNEIDYLVPAYHKIGQKLSQMFSYSESEIGDWLTNRFLRSGRKSLFQDFCEAFCLPQDLIPVMMGMLREVEIEGGLPLKPWAKEFLLGIGHKAAILTNGNPTQQMNKVRLLNLDAVAPGMPVYYAAEDFPKPNPASFFRVAKELGVSPEESLMVGDSHVDLEFSEAAGIAFIYASHLETLWGISRSKFWL